MWVSSPRPTADDRVAGVFFHSNNNRVRVYSRALCAYKNDIIQNYIYTDVLDAPYKKTVVVT